MAAINPYLTFDGNCEEAFDFYKSVFSGEFMAKSRFKDVPPEYAESGPQGEKIMHVALPIGKGTVLMGSDMPEHMGKMIVGNNFAIAFSTDSKEEADNIFKKLSAGGKVTMPMSQVFWGSYFGMMEDKFQIQWMISYDQSPNK